MPSLCRLIRSTLGVGVRNIWAKARACSWPAGGYSEHALMYCRLRRMDSVAYPVTADNVSGPLASRLSPVNQPVISTRNVFQPFVPPSWLDRIWPQNCKFALEPAVLSSPCHPVSGDTIKRGCDRHHAKAVILITPRPGSQQREACRMVEISGRLYLVESIGIGCSPSPLMRPLDSNSSADHPGAFGA